MKRTKLLLFAIGLLFFTSCGKDLYVSYQTENSNTGKIVLKPIKPTPKTYITINDSLIVDRKHVKSVTINNVPEGEYQIHYLSDNNEYKVKLDSLIKVNMKDQNKITKIIEVPPYSTSYWVLNGLFTSLIILLPLIIL